VDLTLPRFSADFRTDLAGVLQAMGMTDLFDDMKADLSGINGNVPERLVIAKVIHQANIDVFEQGTTAAAATVVIGRATMGGDPVVPPKATFHVDHPFLYLLRETTSGAVLFMGAIGNPSSN
jgi:serine protease inhibitor